MKKGKIVVVDDEKVVTSAFSMLLKVEGFSDAHFFNNPKLAIEFLKENQKYESISFKSKKINPAEAELRETIFEGLESGIAENFDPKSHLEALKCEYKNV